MEIITTLLHHAWSFILILSVIVFIHEFGHYFFAKLCGVRVEVFSIGFGRELFGINDRSGTRWKFSLLPFGGYVKMFGDAGEASTPDSGALGQMSEADKAVSFHHKPLWKKAAVVVAGPVANFILTIAVFTYFLYSSGMASTEPVIGEVMPDTPALEAGLMAGDRILSVDGVGVESFGEIARRILPNLGEAVTLKLLRDEDEITLELTPIEFTEKDALGNDVTRPLIGIKSQELTIKDLGFTQAIWLATKRTYEMCETSLTFMGQMITGQRSADQLQGPVGIAKLSGQVTQSGETTEQTLRTILWFIALLSANLGLINLLPIPMLDGGHLAYYGIEALRGKPMAQRYQEFGFRIGLAIIACLMAFTLFNDIRNILL
jgi:regulator of sigma E protease